MKTKQIFIVAFSLAALAVVLGAFAAHGLQNKLQPKLLQTFETAVRYHFYHAIAIALCGIMVQLYKMPQFIWAYRFFVVGIILFSGSLYSLCLLSLGYGNTYNFLGAITPFGGISFIAGWMLMAYGMYKQQ